MARVIARRSLCTRDQVGAIIVDVGNKVIGEGYNGPPSGFWHYQRPCTDWCQRTVNVKIDPKSLHPEYLDCPALHAEANALMMSDRTLRLDGTIYVTSHVCMGCAKLIANSGLHKVWVVTEEEHAHRNSFASYEFMIRCGLKVYVNEKKVVVS